MLTCIACSKQLNTAGSLREAPEGGGNAATPSTKQAMKALRVQLRDMAVKASDAYKNCKPCSGSASHEQTRAYDDSEAVSLSESFYGSYRRAGSSTSTPRLWGVEMETKMKSLSSGICTPVSVSSRAESFYFMEEDEPKEWVAQVEPGVLITFVSLPQGGNDLKRIRFSRDMFNKWRAQQWWAENYDTVTELYNVQRFNHHAVPLPTPPRSEDESSKLDQNEDSCATPPLRKETMPHHFCQPIRPAQLSFDSLEHHRRQLSELPDSGGLNSTPKDNAAETETSSIDASARYSSSSREINHSGELSVSNDTDLESEWVEQDEPGVYITIKVLPDGARELRRVRFSRERFGEMQARLWWEQNRARIQQQYL